MDLFSIYLQDLRSTSNSSSSPLPPPPPSRNNFPSSNSPSSTGNIYRVVVNKWNSIKDIKQKLLSSLNKPVNDLHIYYSTSPYELKDDLLLHDLGVDKSGYIFHLVFDKDDTDVVVIPTQSLSMDSSTNEIISIVKSGFLKHRLPTATDSFDGTGGVYFLREENGSYCAVFKPHDEEQGMPNNPKNYTGRGVCGLREYFQPGQGCLRELAAYLMDYKHFCRVPSTALVHCEHPSFNYSLTNGNNERNSTPKLYPKFGSMQEYVADAEPFDDIGPTLLSDFEVQKIALFDIRLLNCDRNAANILVRKSSSTPSSPSSYHLIPIDHGYCIPPKLKIFEWDWAWFHYPQVSRPVCSEIISYLSSINLDQLLQKVSDHVMLTDDCQYLLRLSHFLLINAFELGLTLKDIASLYCRTGDKEDTPSQLEKIIIEAEENAYRVIELVTQKDGHSDQINDINTSKHRHTPRLHSPSPNVEYSPLRRRSNSSLSSNNLKLFGELISQQIEQTRKQPRSTSEDNTLYLSHNTTTKLTSPKRKSRQYSFPPPSSSLTASLSLPLPPSRERGVSLLSTDSESLSYFSSHSSSSTTTTPPTGGVGGVGGAGGGGGGGGGGEILIGYDLPQRISVDSFASTTSTTIECSEDLISPMNSIVCPNPKHGISLQKFFPSDSLEDERVAVSSPRQDPNEIGKKNPSSPLSPTTILSSFQRPIKPPSTSSSSEEVAVVVDIQIESQMRVDSSQTDYSAPSQCDDEIFLDDDFFQSSQDHTNESSQEYGFYSQVSLPSHDLHSPSLSSSHSPGSLFDVYLPEPIPLSRVASFCGFESSPLCHHDSTPVMNGTTRMEKRRMISETEQFKKLREEYSELFILSCLRRLSSSINGHSFK